MHILSLRRTGKKDNVQQDEKEDKNEDHVQEDKNEDKNEDQKENLDGVILGGWQQRRHEGRSAFAYAVFCRMIDTMTSPSEWINDRHCTYTSFRSRVYVKVKEEDRVDRWDLTPTPSLPLPLPLGLPLPLSLPLGQPLGVGVQVGTPPPPSPWTPQRVGTGLGPSTRVQ